MFEINIGSGTKRFTMKKIVPKVLSVLPMIISWLSLRRFCWSLGLSLGVLAIAIFTVPNWAMADAIAAPQLTVYRSPTCGCCKDWADKMQEAGFQIQDNVIEDVDAIKAEQGVPEDLAACHTALVDGYVLEGHVPVGDIVKLLAEKPDVAGIVVPGMPMGSTGMEQGNEVDPYVTLTFDRAGHRTLFQNHGV